VGILGELGFVKGFYLLQEFADALELVKSKLLIIMETPEVSIKERPSQQAEAE
jgi:hypothetical protein